MYQYVFPDGYLDSGKLDRCIGVFDRDPAAWIINAVGPIPFQQ